MLRTEQETLRRLYRLIVSESPARFWLGIGLAIVGGVAELVGAAGVYPFLALLAKPDLAQTNRYLIAVRGWLHLSAGRDFAIFFGVASLALLVSSTVLLIVRQAYITRYAMGQNAAVSTRLLAAYLRRPYAFFVNENSAELAKNVIAQSDAVTSGTLLPVMSIFSESIIIGLLTALVLWFDPRGGLLVILCLGSIAGLILFFVRDRIQSLGQVSDKANGSRFRFCIEALQSIKEIKAADAETFFWEKFKAPADVFSHAFAEANVAQVLPSPLIQTAALCTIILFALYLVIKGANAADIVPVLSVYAAAGYRLMPSLSRASVSFAQLRQNHSAFMHATDVLGAPAGRDARDARVARLQTKLQIRGIRFSYPSTDESRPVLDGVDATIRRGSLVALAGGSGAGKTTLADILLGLLEPQRGTIEIDGKALSADQMRSWRERVGYIPQSPFLLDDTIAANVAFGWAELDRKRVEEALRHARLDDLVARLPSGIDTRVGERGALLSGGQRQRLAIARALYRDPDLLIMDESTSALDGITEAEILDTLSALKGEKTILIIAHRSTTIKRADNIILLMDGRVRAEGEFDQLVKTSDHFAALMSHAV